MAPSPQDLLIKLSHELGVALELSYDPIELRELWGEALDALSETRAYLRENGHPVPGVVDNILKLSEYAT